MVFLIPVICQAIEKSLDGPVMHSFAGTGFTSPLREPLLRMKSDLTCKHVPGNMR